MRSAVRDAKTHCTLWIALCIVAGGCVETGTPADPALLARSEVILDAFYAWDAAALTSGLGSAEGTDVMFYYQGWAEAAHYEVRERQPCLAATESRITCAVTVNDDFGTTLGYTATDTFTFEFDGGALSTVDFEGDDPAIFTAMLAWMWLDRDEVFDNECVGMFAWGPAPGDCARAVVAAAEAFVVEWPID